MPTYELISAPTCPFVQRSVITLEHKRVPYETRYVDLSDKPTWFLDLSPRGKVPVLVVREAEREVVLFESAVINEYLDEVTDGSLLPSDPLARARHRGMIELASAAIGDAWMMGVADSRDKAMGHAEALRSKLGRFEQDLVGPLFTGEQLSLVDTAVIPLLQRSMWMSEAAPELAVFDGLPKVRAWLDAASKLDAVARSTPKDVREQFLAHLGKREGSWFGAQLAAG